jgi:hypothetical protein
MQETITIEDLIESERRLAVDAPGRYRKYYIRAAECSVFFSRFAKSIDPDRAVFARLHALAKKHHTLALFSTVRLHQVQSAMNLRQVLEAGAAAFAIANAEPRHFVEKDRQGLINPSQKLTRKIYAWLDREYGAGSQSIKEIKGLINETMAHANLIYTNNLFEIDDEERVFLTPFFDRVDAHHVKTDLWRIGRVGIVLLDLFYGVNHDRNVIKLVDDFVPRFDGLAEQNRALHAEMTSTERYKRDGEGGGTAGSG